MIQQKIIEVNTEGKGLYDVTQSILDAVKLPSAGILNCFLKHTSASLMIQENSDPTAKQDLETFLNKLVPDNQAWHQHTIEGVDDTTSHMKAAVTHVDLNIPIVEGTLALGTWQGIYLWEHRMENHVRKILLTVLT